VVASFLKTCAADPWRLRHITSFDVSGQGTFAVSISPTSAITGFYIDASNAFHGFRRTKSGSGIPIKGNYCLYEGRQFWVMAAER